MLDVQSNPDGRGLAIQKVGVKNVRYPVRVLDRRQGRQCTIASVSLYVDLPHDLKGTHMSRFIEVLNNHRQRIGRSRLEPLLMDLIQRFDAQSAHVEISFPYFIEKEAPVSRQKAHMDYECRLLASYEKEKAAGDFIVGVKVPVTTVCPCSKAISERGAHNQRSEVLIEVRHRDFIWLEELIDAAESCASSPVYALLKREDEKFVTENGYDHPQFAEDLVRDITRKLSADPRITWLHVASENFESIHNHSAYASLEMQNADLKQGGESGRCLMRRAAGSPSKAA